MTTNPDTIDPAEIERAVRLLAATKNMSIESFESFLAAQAGPRVADDIAGCLPKLTERTRETYAVHYRRLLRGVPPVCDQSCEPCLKRKVIVDPAFPGRRFDGYECTCPCSKCVDSRISIAPLGDQFAGPAVYTKSLVEELAEVARRYAVKRGIVDNRKRAKKSKPAKRAEGRNAAETAINALSTLFRHAAAHMNGANPAHQFERPKRNPKERRALMPFELAELHLVTATGGDDPELDLLLVDTGIATSARVAALTKMKMNQLLPATQMIAVRDKGNIEIEMPVSAELLERLLEHAISRGGNRCDPTHPDFDSEARVFYQRDGKPMSERRFDTLAGRWQRSLDWASAEQVAFHHLRHCISAQLSVWGEQYKRRYLRHSDKNVTDTYGRCPVENLAAALGELLGFEHPLVNGFEERRTTTLRRLGMIYE